MLHLHEVVSAGAGHDIAVARPDQAGRVAVDPALVGVHPRLAAATSLAMRGDPPRSEPVRMLPRPRALRRRRLRAPSRRSGHHATGRPSGFICTVIHVAETVGFGKATPTGGIYMVVSQRRALRRALTAVLFVPAATLGGSAAHAAVSNAARSTASMPGDAASMIETGVTPSAIGVSVGGGVLVGGSALAVRAGRRPTGSPVPRR